MSDYSPRRFPFSRFLLNRLLVAMMIFLGLVALSTSWEARAQTQPRFENLDRVDGLVATTMGARIGEPGGAVAPVDRRLRLAACPQLPRVDGPVSGAATVSCATLGWRLRVPLINGAPAAAPVVPLRRATTPAIAEAPPIIRKGDPVRLIAGDDSFTVSRAMIADEDGQVGAPIRVRESARSPAVTARVEAAGIVRMPGV